MREWIQSKTTEFFSLDDLFKDCLWIKEIWCGLALNGVSAAFLLKRYFQPTEHGPDPFAYKSNGWILGLAIHYVKQWMCHDNCFLASVISCNPSI